MKYIIIYSVIKVLKLYYSEVNTHHFEYIKIPRIFKTYWANCQFNSNKDKEVNLIYNNLIVINIKIIKDNLHAVRMRMIIPSYTGH